VRSYLRHEPILAFSLVASPSTTARVHLDPRDGRTAFAPALEDVLVWDVKHGTQLAAWHETGHRAQVTALTRSPAVNSSNVFAVGYADGSIRLWDAQAGTTILTFNGHKSAVTTLAFDPNGLSLASGSQDTELILWDVVAEAGLFRLSGHRNAITQVAFVPELPLLSDQEGSEAAGEADAGPSSRRDTALSSRYLLSTSKDGFLKLWDLSLQHCIETAIPGKGEIWSMATALVRNIDPAKATKKAQADSDASTPSIVVLTGGTEGQTRVYELDIAALRVGLARGSKANFFHDRGSIPLSANNRVSQIEFSTLANSQKRAVEDDVDFSEPDYVAISSSDRSAQVFRVRTEEELRKKFSRQKRRKAKELEQKRERGVKDVQDAEDDTEAPTPTWIDRVELHAIVRPSAGGRLRSFSLALASSGSANASSRALSTSKPALNVLLGLSNNALETWHVPAPLLGKAERSAMLLQSAEEGASANATTAEPSLSASLDLPGHRSDVRAMALSPDDTLLASADSSGILKIWNVRSGRCVRTFTGCGTRFRSCGSLGGGILCSGARTAVSGLLTYPLRSWCSILWVVPLRRASKARTQPGRRARLPCSVQALLTRAPSGVWRCIRTG